MKVFFFFRQKILLERFSKIEGFLERCFSNENERFGSRLTTNIYLLVSGIYFHENR